MRGREREEGSYHWRKHETWDELYQERRGLWSTQCEVLAVVDKFVVAREEQEKNVRDEKGKMREQWEREEWQKREERKKNEREICGERKERMRKVIRARERERGDEKDRDRQKKRGAEEWGRV